MNTLGMLAQFEIHVSDACYETTDDPSRPHVKKRWMSDAYHARIQKKWVKRFGFYKKPAAYRMGDKVICHPLIADMLRKQFKS